MPCGPSSPCQREGSLGTEPWWSNASIVACGMVWNASRVFHGRKPNLPGLLFGAIVWIGTVLKNFPMAFFWNMYAAAPFTHLVAQGL